MSRPDICKIFMSSKKFLRYMKPDIERLMWGGGSTSLVVQFLQEMRDPGSEQRNPREIPWNLEEKNTGVEKSIWTWLWNPKPKKVDPEKVTKIASSTSLSNFRHCWPGICQFGEFHSKQLNLSFSKLSKFLKSLHWCKNCTCFCEDSGFRGRYPPPSL